LKRPSHMDDIEIHTPVGYDTPVSLASPLERALEIIRALLAGRDLVSAAGRTQLETVLELLEECAPGMTYVDVYKELARQAATFDIDEETEDWLLSFTVPNSAGSGPSGEGVRSFRTPAADSRRRDDAASSELSSSFPSGGLRRARSAPGGGPPAGRGLKRSNTSPLQLGASTTGQLVVSHKQRPPSVLESIAASERSSSHRLSEPSAQPSTEDDAPKADDPKDDDPKADAATAFDERMPMLPAAPSAASLAPATLAPATLAPASLAPAATQHKQRSNGSITFDSSDVCTAA
jgi:hypothetical protein